MGPRPFLTLLKAYARILPNVLGSPKSVQERVGKLRYIHDIVQLMHARGEVATTNPQKFGEKEITALNAWMQRPDLYLLLDPVRRKLQKGARRPDEGFGGAYKEKLWTHISEFLTYCHNDILGTMEREGTWKRPKRSKRKRYKDEEWFRDAMARLEAASGWLPTLIRFTTAFTWYIAPRSKELRLAEVDDLDLKRRVFRVRHPKGEGAYGVEFEEVAFDERFLPYAEDFLAAREARIHLFEMDPEKVKPLAPTERGGFYNDTTWNSTRWKTFKKLGIEGDYRILRKSSLQNYMREVEELGDYKDMAVVELEARRGRHSIATALEHYVEYTQNRANKVYWEIAERRKARGLVSVEPRRDAADALRELQRLRDEALITAEEFERLRAGVLERTMLFRDTAFSADRGLRA